MDKTPKSIHRPKCILALLLLASCLNLSATVVKVNRVQTFRQEVSPETVDNYMFATYFSNAKNAYNQRGYEIGSAGNKIQDLKINPAGYSFALLYGKPGKTAVKIRSLNPARNINAELKGLIAPTAICYMPDSRQIAIADDGKIKFYDSKTYGPVRQIPATGSPSRLVISPNGYLAIAASTQTVKIISLSDGAIRKEISVASEPSVAFNQSGSQFGILTSDGTLSIYSAADMSEINTINNLGASTNLFFHPAENYAGIVTENNRVQFVNLYNSADRPVIYDTDVNWANFLRDGHNNLYLASSGKDIIKYREIDGFLPNYGILLNQEVEALMREWTKMRPGETELEYRERVNEESMRQQRILFANQVATEMALTAGLGAFADVTLGRYNPNDGTLIVSLGGLNDIYLKVPQEDMAGFGSGNDLQFSNHVFSLNSDNSFELIYVQVYNPTNGKTYTFDNLDKQNLSFLMSDSGFVSLDLILQSSREEVLLQGIKDRIIDEARRNNLISNHTTINVDNYIEPAIDDKGRHINNYHVDFTYMVDAKGSATEDFAPGKYLIEQSPAAMSLALIIQQAFTNEFAQYLVSGKTLVIDVTGSADALPINGVIAYEGSLGEYDEEPCYIDGNLTTVSVNSMDGIRTNEQLAFMRAQSIKNNMIQNLPQLKEMNLVYKNNIEVSKEKGAEHRRINVSLIFIDAYTTPSEL